MPVIRLAASLLLVSLFCGASAHAQVDPANPVSSTPSLLSITPLPNATGPLFQATTQQTDATGVHEGVFTWGLDLLQPPMTDFLSWTNSHDPSKGNGLEFTASPAFELHLDSALVAGGDKLGQADPGNLASIFTAFADAVNLIPGAHAEVVSLPEKPVTSFFGYTPVRARWLRSQWVPSGPILIAPPYQVYKQFVYDDYLAFRDIRLRGARFYCAAREAQKQQNGQRLSLGERVGFGVSVLGHQIDFMVVEPSVALDGPDKFFAPNDGAQAFTIPLLFGTTVTPIRGIGLPSLGESRVPVVLITGDSEVETTAEKGQFVGVPGGWMTDYRKRYRTVTHTDAFVTAGFYGDSRFEVNTDFLLFTVGPISVHGDLALKYNVGVPQVNTTDVPDNRVLFNFPSPWPASRTGWLLTNPLTGNRYHDGAWAFAAHRGSPYFQWEVQPEGSLPQSIWTSPIYPYIRSHDVRALTDDDHTFSSETALRLDLALRGVLGIDDFDPFKVTLEVDGGLNGRVAQHTMVRDALIAEAPVGIDAMRPSTLLTLRPRQTASVAFSGLTAKLKFSASFPFIGTVSFTKTFIDTKAEPLAEYDSDTTVATTDEQYMLRIANGATAGSTMTQPNVLSHLPGRSDFKTFPQSVAACLADATPLLPPPPPCQPTAPVGAPPSVNLCLYGPSPFIQENLIGKGLPPDVCPNIQGFVAPLSISAGQKLCLTKYLNFMCQPVSNKQSINGFNVLTRLWDLDKKLSAELVDIVGECGDAFIGPDQSAEEFVSGLVGVSVCDKNATLIPDSEIINAISPTTPPSASPGICKP